MKRMVAKVFKNLNIGLKKKKYIYIYMILLNHENNYVGRSN